MLARCTSSASMGPSSDGDGNKRPLYGCSVVLASASMGPSSDGDGNGSHILSNLYGNLSGQFRAAVRPMAVR
jgi:hypothetical protein